MKLNNVLFIAAQTNRSKSYAQALLANKVEIGNILLLGSEKDADNNDNPQTIHNVPGNTSPHLIFADYKLHLKDTCHKLSDNILELDVTNINEVTVLEIVKNLKPELVIYSGFGGQIVSAELLAECPFLHVHAGILPEYRGSTTIYYSILKERKCGVTSILLQPEIDTGSIVIRKYFPMPHEDIDIDHHYDGAIRASVLIDSLEKWHKNQLLDSLINQDETNSETYYVIHPVLKHIAILSLDSKTM